VSETPAPESTPEPAPAAEPTVEAAAKVGIDELIQIGRAKLADVIDHFEKIAAAWEEHHSTLVHDVEEVLESHI
jgi:hypothetical protein